jgi:hypothetical protein
VRAIKKKMQSKQCVFSGMESITRVEDWSIFVRGMFMIEGYYETIDEIELLEMLFMVTAREGRMIRRVFKQCTFSFIDFTHEEITRLMAHLVSVKRGNIQFAFFNCRVLLNGERFEYLFPQPSYTVPNELWSLGNIVRHNLFARYHLKDARIEVKGESKEFFDLYQWKMLSRRSKTKIDFTDFQAALILSRLNIAKSTPLHPSYRILIEDVDNVK